jgi:hypothetical protein
MVVVFSIFFYGVIVFTPIAVIYAVISAIKNDYQCRMPWEKGNQS